MTRELVPYATGVPALPDEREISPELTSLAADLANKSHSDRTRQEYNRCCQQFGAWCEKEGRNPLPANPDTLAAYIAFLMGGGKASSTINQAVAAIRTAHQHNGMTLDTKHVVVQRVWKGARRQIAKTRGIRRVKPLMQDDLVAILDMLNPDVLREARDAAILSLGWGQARRCMELIGLDWHQRGDGTGYTVSDDIGLTTTLMTSKASQEGGDESYILARAHASRLCKAVENWVELARIERGSPLFRAIQGKGDGKTVSKTRLHRSALARIMKRRIGALLRTTHAGRRKLRQVDIDAAIADYSSHSMRVGHVSSAANRKVPVHHIQKTTGHKTATMINLYSRGADAVEHSSLKGSGLNE